MLRTLAFLLILFVASGAAGLETFPTGTLSIVTAKGEKTFRIEIARTPRQHAQGLMYRRELAPDAGMLFVFDRPERAAFWMKNTYIPLDMVFIAPDGRIESIRQRTVPLSLTPVRSRGKVLAVLELNSGTASHLGIKPGDEVRNEVFGNAKR